MFISRDARGCGTIRVTQAAATEAVLDADVPLYHQIYLHLRAEIADGAWVGRDDFPGEIDLAKRFGVSVITSRRALSRLSEEGYIDRGRGRRTKVVRDPSIIQNAGAPALIQTAPGLPRAFTYDLLTRGVDVAPAEACAAFRVPPGSKLWLCSRLRRFEGRAHSVTLNAQRIELGATLPRRKLLKMPMTQILRDSGISFSRLSRHISAVLAPPNVAVHLGLTLNDPTLVYTFTHHDDSDVVVQWVRIWVRTDEPGPNEVFSYTTGTWNMSAAM